MVIFSLESGMLPSPRGDGAFSGVMGNSTRWSLEEHPEAWAVCVLLILMQGLGCWVSLLYFH